MTAFLQRARFPLKQHCIDAFEEIFVVTLPVRCHQGMGADWKPEPRHASVVSSPKTYPSIRQNKPDTSEASDAAMAKDVSTGGTS